MGAQIVVSVGAVSLERAEQFYVGGLGLPIDRAEGPFVAFTTEHGTSGLALYSAGPLAFESGLVDGYRGVAFSYLVDGPQQVDEVMVRAERSGGQVRRPADRADWGGYIGYLTDPDGNLWKVVTART
jgi:catechol 2,3-dioxygenase-like lactoylglutathione lyase family enzyme